MDGLEVYWQKETRDVDDEEEEAVCDGAGPDLSLGNEGEWDEGYVAEVPVPDEEDYRRCASSGEEANDDGGVPWVFVTAP